MSRLLLHPDDTGGLSSRSSAKSHRRTGYRCGSSMCCGPWPAGYYDLDTNELIDPPSPASSSHSNAGDKAPSAAPRRSSAEGADILEFAPAPRMPVATCDERDIAAVYTNVENIFDLALSALQGRIGLIRERVPITHVQSFFDLDEEFAQLKYRYLSRLLEMDRS